MSEKNIFKTVALGLVQQLNKTRELYQEDAVDFIEKTFGNDFIYDNENGNPAIDRKVLAEFRKLTKGKVVWSRGERYWRFRDAYDNSDSRVTE